MVGLLSGYTILRASQKYTKLTHLIVLTHLWIFTDPCPMKRRQTSKKFKVSCQRFRLRHYATYEHVLSCWVFDFVFRGSIGWYLVLRVLIHFRTLCSRNVTYITQDMLTAIRNVCFSCQNAKLRLGVYMSRSVSLEQCFGPSFWLSSFYFFLISI